MIDDPAHAETDVSHDPTEPDWAPTRASTAIVLLGTAAGAAALATAAGVPRGTVAAGAGAVCLAGALGLLTVERWRAPATFAASLLLVPAGAGLAVGVGYESLVAVAASFPAASPTRVVGEMLRIAGVLAVLAGCTTAAFGAVASVRGVVTRRAVSRCLGVAVRVALLPAALFAALAGHAAVTNLDLGVAGALGDLVAAATGWLLAPAPGRLHLLAFSLLLAAAGYAAHRALRELPTRELAGDAAVGDVGVADALAALRRGLGRVATVALLAVPPAFLFEVAGSTGVLRETLPAGVYDSLVAVTAAPGLRALLWWTAIGAGGLAAIAALVRRSSRTSTRELLVGYAPFAAGLAVVAGAAAVHRPVLDALVGFVAGRLEPPLTGQFRDLSDSAVTFYGPETVVLGLAAGVLVLAAGAVLALSVAFGLGFVPADAAGPALAGGGLFLAAGFAGTVAAPLWVVLGGLVAALVVWDAGEFAAALGSEVGRRAETRRVELLHALAALSVGGVAALAAGALARIVPAGPSAVGLGDLSVALFAAVAGAVLLVMALR
ncbi:MULTISPECIES: hypothetical protein [Halorussus]|uniref:DUF7519 family protein n=1 Tax=Halorussus TaxID=1070314 RepID=UPI000E21563B|nr:MULTISPECIES: hypothetical protein [Halorussus]NHN58804.1 hypothetical protein [Halorussus sp. JP-T4]